MFASAAFGANAVSWWFVLDSAFSLLHRAFFNVWLVNGPCLLILGVPPAALRRAFTGPNAAQ